MKQTVLLLVAICTFAFLSPAATYTINVADFSFSPTTLTVHPGDMITWVWVSGSHTTTSTTIPSGATAWDNPINATNTSFTYTVPAITGTYNYHCTPHASMGMTGSFTVVNPTNIPDPGQQPAFSFYPNPASQSVHMQLPVASVPATVSLVALSGQRIIQANFNQVPSADLDLQNIATGVYLLCVEQNGTMYKKELSVTH